jgi:hypothetical protein
MGGLEVKKVYIILLIVTLILTLISCKRSSIDTNQKIYQKVQTLYNDKHQELTVINDGLISWRKEILNTSSNSYITIEKNQNTKWQYYTDNYERVDFEWKDEYLGELIKSLFDDYDVKNISIDNTGIWFYISEDALIYSIDNNELTSTYVEHIEGNWYQFKFPYGI